MRDRYIFSVPSKEDYDYINGQVQIEEAGQAYKRISTLTGVVENDILGILRYDEKKLTIDIDIDYQAHIPEVAPLKQINIMNRFEVQVDKTTFQQLVSSEDDDKVVNIEKTISEMTGLDSDTFFVRAGSTKTSSFIIEIPAEKEVIQNSALSEHFSTKN